MFGKSHASTRAGADAADEDGAGGLALHVEAGDQEIVAGADGARVAS